MESCVFCVALLRTKYQQIILVCKATHISAHNNPILLDLGIRYAAAIGPCERQIKVGKHSWDEPKDHWPCRSYVQRCIRAKLGTCASYVLPLWHETNYNKVDRGRKDDVILGVFCPVLSCQNTICWNSKEISYAFIDCRSLRRSESSPQLVRSSAGSHVRRCGELFWQLPRSMNRNLRHLSYL